MMMVLGAAYVLMALAIACRAPDHLYGTLRKDLVAAAGCGLWPVCVLLLGLASIRGRQS